MKMEHQGQLFENVVVKIFTRLGFEVSSGASTQIVDKKKVFYVDIIATNKEAKLAIEVKLSKSPNYAYSFLLRSIHFHLARVRYLKTKHVPILVVGGIVSPDARNRIKDVAKDIILIDIENLIYLCESSEDLKTELFSLLDYSAESLTPKIPDKTFFAYTPLKEINLKESHEIPNDYIIKLKKIKAGRNGSTKYENVCCEIIKFLFSKELSIFKKQKKSNNGLFRFDLICKIKSENMSDFWRTIENHFNSKYIVFEFKNYSEEISQQEIFTTEKYLYGTALRKVAILVSPEGLDANAERAVSGILRESGKLIISITNNDIIKMLEDKTQKPSDHLSNKLDDLLIELDK